MKKMKLKLSCVILFLFFYNLKTYSQHKELSPACRIQFQSENFKNKMYYLASNYGKYQTLLDSVIGTSEGKVVFKKEKKYVEGIYMLVTKDKNIEMEFVMDENQHFIIEPNSKDPQKTKIQNSPLNIDFQTFNAFFISKSNLLKDLNAKLTDQKTKKDSAIVVNEIKIIQNEINVYKYNYIKKNTPNTLALLLRLTQPVDDFLNKPEDQILKTKKDSVDYLKKHFFDGIHFNDPRLLRNPFLENKISSYFNYFVQQNPEEITKSVFEILDQTEKPDSDTFKYLSLYFVDLYAEPKIMGLDRVFLNIYDTYFKNKTYDWLKPTQLEFFKYKVTSLKDNQIGDKGPNIFMLSLDNDKRIDLFDVQAPYIVLAFWDPTCGHCAVEIPKMKALYDKEWKQKGIVVFAINSNTNEMVKWKEFIEKEKLQDWIHVYPPKVLNGNYTKEEVDFQTLYNVRQTPVFYLLDKDKKIIAKKVGIENYKDIILNLKK
jgi:peroxiredoxin